MSSTIKLYLYTFLGIGFILALTGYFGINLSLKYFQTYYVQLQIDVNKRQAEHMAMFIGNELKKGVPPDTVIREFQASIAGTEYDKGFLCMYDTRQMKLVCHPDVNAIGMKFTSDFLFKDIHSNAETYIGNIYNTHKPAGGIFIQGKMRTDIVYTVPVEGSNWYVNAHENIDAISKELMHLRLHYIIGSMILGLVIALAASVTARRISRNYEKQIEQKNREITRHRDEIAFKNKEITDSINYAERIQTAVLPHVSILKEYTTEHFVIYKPKDIISGDFYWFARVNEYFIIAAADCTGHGVPGAFMSMLGMTLLNELVNHRQQLDAKEILNSLRSEIKLALRQQGDPYEQKDGMDIALCIIDPEKHRLYFAGAYNPLYLLRKEGNAGSYILYEYKADKMPIGVSPKDDVSFSEQLIEIRKDDRVYIFSDGFSSQFGGERNTTFKSKRLQELLLGVQGDHMASQKEHILQTLAEWQGNNEQVDDILLIGFSIPS